MEAVELGFRAMASGVRVLLVGAAPDVPAWVEARIDRLERRWSRFLATSEISRINRGGSGAYRVSADTCRLLESMQLASVATEGRYDPTMLTEICAAGYVDSADGSGARSVIIDLPTPGRSILDVEIDHRRAVVVTPPGLGIDPGGIGKGLAADIVVQELLETGRADGVLVSIGGDLAAAGRSPESHGGTRWQVAVADPLHRVDEVQRIAVDAGGVATSSTRSRRWIHAGRRRHHILDPAHRRQSTTDVAAVTVVARAGWLAEAHATSAILQPAERVRDHLEAQGLEGIAVTDSGSLIRTEGLARRPTHAATAGAS